MDTDLACPGRDAACNAASQIRDPYSVLRHSGALAKRASPATVLAVKRLWCVAGVIFNEGICGYEQLSGDGDESEFGGLSLASQV